MAPLARPDCPLCGRPNGCAVAASGRFETPCWCTETTFAPELLARIPVAERGRSCVCAACAAAAHPPAL
jgi:hypothetical protein